MVTVLKKLEHKLYNPIPNSKIKHETWKKRIVSSSILITEMQLVSELCISFTLIVTAEVLL